MKYFKVSYKLITGQKEEAVFTGPEDATEVTCLRIVQLAASNYKVLPETIVVEKATEVRLSKGFLHPLQALHNGNEVPIKGWYI